MANWDDEEWEADVPSRAPGLPSAAIIGNWDDEDASDDEPEQVIKKAPAPMKPSKLRAKALKEKEEREHLEEVAKIKAREKELAEMDAVQRKIRQQQLIEEADSEHTKDLFMGGPNDAIDMPAEPTIDTFKAVTDADYKKLATMIGEKCSELNDNPKRTGRYVGFVKDLIRAVTKDLGPDDAKDLSTYMGLISNEKRDEFKKSKGIKKKAKQTKAHVRVDRDDTPYDNSYDDFNDDFM